MPVATKTNRREAERRERAAVRLERIGVRTAVAIGNLMRAEGLRRYVRGEDPAGAIDAAMEKLRPVILDGMVAGHLYGRLEVFKHLERKFGESVLLALKLAPQYEDAIDYAKARMGISQEQINALRDMYGDEAIKTVHEVGGAAKDKVARALRTIMTQQLHVRDGVKVIRQAFKGFVEPKPFLLETIFRSQTHLAYSAGQWNANQHPAIDQILWGYEYVTARDDRVRPSHVALDGTRYRKDSGELQRLWPPNGWNCRCSLVEIFHSDRRIASEIPPPREVVIDGQAVKPGPDVGWDFNPGRIYRDVLTH